jgi:hypothetical protein
VKGLTQMGEEVREAEPRLAWRGGLGGRAPLEQHDGLKEREAGSHCDVPVHNGLQKAAAGTEHVSPLYALGLC